jgi:hypothetical protein
MTPPSGLDSLQVRRAYFRKRHSRHFGGWGLTTSVVSFGVLIGWLFIAGFTGLGH